MKIKFINKISASIKSMIHLENFKRCAVALKNRLTAPMSNINIFFRKWFTKVPISLNIKKRLIISNILMIVIPVTICSAIGAAGVGLIWNFAIDGTALGFADSEEFYERAAGTAKIVEEMIMGKKSSSHEAKKFSHILKNNMISVKVYNGDILTYNDGDNTITLPEKLVSASKSLNNECTIVQGEYCLYAHKIEHNGHTYQLFLTAKTFEPSYATLKVCIVILILILIAAVILSVWFTNRFLTRFVFRKIEKPLEILESSVAQIRDGNLDYRIQYNENNEFLPVCNAFNEMTSRLKKSVEQTLKNEQSRKELLAGISHDIRSPLTSIQAYVEGLLDGVADTPERRKKYLLTIKQKSESISNMVTQIFTFSKLELDDFPVNLIKSDIKTQLEKIILPIADEYSKKGLKILMNVKSNMICLDCSLLCRICTNILSNTLKYNQNQNPYIRIYSETDQNSYILHFADNGNGVDNQILDKLFDVFYRSDPARNNPDKGSGLGLAIVANAVKRMNGCVTAQNVIDGGLDIIISLPLEDKNE